MLGAALHFAPSAVTRPLLPGAVTVLVAGVFQELIQLMLQQYQGIVTDDCRAVSTPGRGSAGQGAMSCSSSPPA